MSVTSSRDIVAESVASGENLAEGTLIMPRLPKSEAMTLRFAIASTRPMELGKNFFTKASTRLRTYNFSTAGQGRLAVISLLRLGAS